MFSGSFQVFSRDILRIIWFGGSCGSSGLDESAWLRGSGWSVVLSWTNSGIFFLFNLIREYFKMEILSFMIQNNLMIPK